MIAVSDPVGTGLIVESRAPGRECHRGVLQRRPGNLRHTAGAAQGDPKVRRAAILPNPANPVHALVIRDVKVAARSLGVQLQLLEVRGPDEFDGAFAAMAKERVGALLVVPDSMFFLHRTRLIDLAARSSLPAAYGSRETVQAGGLMSYGPSNPDLFRRAATYVDKILKGAKPGDLPVEQPTRFELIINRKTAKALGLTIPPVLLLRADQVIE